MLVSSYSELPNWPLCQMKNNTYNILLIKIAVLLSNFVHYFTMLQTFLAEHFFYFVDIIKTISAIRGF